MKKLIVLFCLLAVSAIKAQAPQYLNYQGIARDAGGTIITTAIGVKFEILQGSASGTVVYDETNTITPSSAGIFTTAIGSGAPGVGTFSLITWANGPYYIRVNIDPAGGTSYSTVGTSQLLSVPYALYAEKAGNTQTVSITGSNVTGTYPNYTITSAGALTPSTGISIVGNTITNTAPNPTLTPAGITSITGTHPSFTIDVPPPSLNYNIGTNVLTLTQGTTVATTTLVGAGSSTVSMFANGIASVTPVGAGNNFTVSVQSPSFTSVGATSVTGTYPNFVINSPGASTTIPTSLQVNLPHTTSTLSPNNFSITIAPTNISGPGVIGSYPNYTVTAPAATTLTGVGIASVTGSSPNYTIGVPGPSLSVTGNTITITQGTVVTTKTISSSPWNYSGGTIIPANNPSADKVAIGQVSANALVDVLNSPSSTITTSPVLNVVNSNTGFGGNGVLVVRNLAGTSAGINVDQTTNGDGIAVNMTSAGITGNALQVNHSGLGNASFFSINNASSNSKIIDASTTGTGIGVSVVVSNSVNANSALAVSSNGTGATGYFNKTNTGYGIYSSHSGSSGVSGFFEGINTSNVSPVVQINAGSTSGGPGAVINTVNGNALEAYSGSSNYAAYIVNTSTVGGNAIRSNNNNSAPTIYADNSSTGRALFVQNPSSSTNRAAQIIGGLDIMGKTSGSTTSPLIITNIASTNLFNVRDDGNVGVGNPTPNNRLSVYDAANTSAALFSQQNSATSSSSAHGVMGITSNSNTFAAGVHGESSGAGPAVSGSKFSGSGSAGRFEITSTTNTADGLFSTTSGGGAAIHAVNGPTVAGGSNAALWLEAGHLKSTQATPPTTNTISVSGGGISSVTVTLNAGSTDVKGTLLAVITTTGLVNANNNFSFRVNFNKTYASNPVVVVCPSSDNGLLDPFVSGVAPTSFSVTVKNGTTGNMTTGATFSLNLNYIVIE